MKYCIIDGNYLTNLAVHRNPETALDSFFAQVCGYFSLGKMIIVFDSPTPSFRKEIYPAYKAHRGKTDKEKEMRALVVKNIKIIKRILSRAGVTIIELDGLEGDDVAYFLSKGLSLSGNEVTVVSGDKDFLQFCANNVCIYFPRNDKFIDRDNFIDEVGVPLEAFVIWKSIIGDSSDGIKGIKGIGEKGATKIIDELNEYSIKALLDYANLEETTTTKKIKENFKEFKRSLQLIDIERHPKANELNELYTKLDEYKNELNFEEFKLLCNKYNVKSIGKWVYNLMRG